MQADELEWVVSGIGRVPPNRAGRFGETHVDYRNVDESVSTRTFMREYQTSKCDLAYEKEKRQGTRSAGEVQRQL